MLKEIMENVREKKPIIHNITNYVTVKDCANILLACGASPIMSDEEEEVEDLINICQGLNINIGTVNSRTLNAMIKAGKEANRLNIPVIFDPVGVGASKLRRESAEKIIKEVNCSVINGNATEIKNLVAGTMYSNGVDAREEDRITGESIEETICFSKKLAKTTESIVVTTGEIDIITDGEKAYCVLNGISNMDKITGTGCQVSALISGFAAANPDNIFEATVGAVCAMGICGEKAYRKLNAYSGNIEFGTNIIDEVYNLFGEELEVGAKFEIH